MTHDAPLHGRVVVVTGAGGSIGAAAVQGFEERGATVFAVDRDVPQENDRRAGVEYRTLDITDHRAVDDLAVEVVRENGRLDGWINNAGVLVRATALELTPEAWDRTMDVNLKGAFFAAQAAARQMIQAGRGVIVNVASYAGLKARPNCADYASSKAALIHLTSCLAVEWGPLGLRVNAIAPGYVDTPMSAWMRESPEVFAQYMDRTPSRRLGEPLDIAQAMAYLVGDESAYVNGHTLVVDGGISLT
ncbi:SDR family NAD(P)-dependent oxidoreductase [Kineococcus rhizosphaerae]|uniref:NAD(P)-dependent dehydrogenase (Short-subunit alcohol dehydrogenase family) n=1 Tax=Kineococcus rhizosphaerae TaxID=559628 RepID=A0A2T0QUS9_9ACTN|nr:SDR family oxidoreductase [Kineococcus rhizosphaerae]PRY08927.1 NAD(P)-dependent dehydrogenase (short-subunit alcohol dehydrogenase family) [Kineococcus rhizosphaerae]